MAVTRGGYVALDDSEIAAEQPLTTSKMNRLRDNHYDALTNPVSVAPSDFRVSLPLRAKTTETDTSKVLQPNGSGGVDWGDVPAGDGEEIVETFRNWTFYYDNDTMIIKLRKHIHTFSYGWLQIYYFNRNGDRWIFYREDANTRMYSVTGTSEYFDANGDGVTSTTIAWDQNIFNEVNRQYYL